MFGGWLSLVPFCFVLFSLICSAIAFARIPDQRISVLDIRISLTSASAARVFLFSLAVFNAASACCARISLSSSSMFATAS